MVCRAWCTMPSSSLSASSRVVSSVGFRLPGGIVPLAAGVARGRPGRGRVAHRAGAHPADPRSRGSRGCGPRRPVPGRHTLAAGVSSIAISGAMPGYVTGKHPAAPRANASRAVRTTWAVPSISTLVLRPVAVARFVPDHGPYAPPCPTGMPRHVYPPHVPVAMPCRIAPAVPETRSPSRLGA